MVVSTSRPRSGSDSSALRSVTEALKTRDRDQNAPDQLDDGQLTRIADGLDTVLEVLDEAAERD